jgi:predicted phosphodiesterase
MSVLRLAILSDVHGNAVALDAVLADMERLGVTQSVCLGDAVQGGPQPSEVVARLRSLGCPVVMGNADAWLLSGVETGSEKLSEAQREIRAWSLAQLSPADREFVAAFAPVQRVPLMGGGQLLAFHGSPASSDDFIFPHTPQEDVGRMLLAHEADVYAGGHTHVQQARHLGQRMFINPGSVGLAYRHDQPEEGFRADPWAEYAVISVGGGAWSVDFRRIVFDVEALLRACRDSGRPHYEQVRAMYRGG